MNLNPAMAGSGFLFLFGGVGAGEVHDDAGALIHVIEGAFGLADGVAGGEVVLAEEGVEAVVEQEVG